MRTPLELARALGWPEVKQADVMLWPPSPIEDGRAAGPVSMRLEQRPKLRLRVTRGRLGTGRWCWRIINEHGEWHTGGAAPSQPAALALGLAALDTATVRTGR